MIFEEVYPTEARRETIQKTSKRAARAGQDLLFCEDVPKRHISPLKTQDRYACPSADAQREPEFVSIKRTLLEIKVLIGYLFAMEKELSFPPTDPTPLLSMCDALLASLDRYLPAVLLYRKETLPAQFEKQIETCLAQIERYAKTDPTIAREHRENFLSTHRKEIQRLARHFSDNFDRFEAQVLGQVRSLLLMENPDSLFQLLYSFSGALYIVIEASGHFLGVGSGKITSRAFLLQTAETVALIRSKMLFPEGESTDTQSDVQKTEFFKALDESDLLLQLKGTTGIVSLRETHPLQERRSTPYLPHRRLLPRWQFGTNFEKSVGKKGDLPLDVKKTIAKDLLTGLYHIHSQQIIHHDISPDNVLLDLLSARPRAALCDFNSAFHTERRPMTGFIQIKWIHSPPNTPKSCAKKTL